MSLGNKKDRVIVDAKSPLKFKITDVDIIMADRADGATCVVAQGVRHTVGDFFDGIQVGSTVTKIYTSDRVLRYATPNAIKMAIPVYDKTGNWNLPPGEYRLNVLAPTQSRGGRNFHNKARWAKHRNKPRTTGRDMFKARNLPTRRVKRAEFLASV